VDTPRALSRIDELIAATESALRAEMGNATSCEIHKDGRVTGGMKYLEGKLVAFTRIRRLVAQTTGADDAAGAAADEVASWEAEWRLRAEAADSSPPWAAYATGGLDAAREAAKLFGD
jgi:hypothetical protein